ncbi:MAG TPA: hypothetical protein VGL13_00160, partial [Polyangiaceae bacterium]
TMGGAGDLVVAERAPSSPTFTNFQPLDVVNTSMWIENDPWLSLDGTELYFTSNRGMFDAGQAWDSAVLDPSEAPSDRIYHVVFDRGWAP